MNLLSKRLWVLAFFLIAGPFPGYAESALESFHCRSHFIFKAHGSLATTSDFVTDKDISGNSRSIQASWIDRGFQINTTLGRIGNNVFIDVTNPFGDQLYSASAPFPPPLPNQNSETISVTTVLKIAPLELELKQLAQMLFVQCCRQSKTTPHECVP